MSLSVNEKYLLRLLALRGSNLMEIHGNGTKSDRWNSPNDLSGDMTKCLTSFEWESLRIEYESWYGQIPEDEDYNMMRKDFFILRFLVDKLIKK